ncbi:MAG: type transport system permease protein [Actinomycetota bacterium]|nr:type transport system permease protein [Actinomycetota bacterium]
MNATVARLTARSLLGRRRALLLLALPAVLLVLAVASRVLGGQDDGLTVGLLGGFAVATLVPLLGLIAGTGAIGPEIDDGSIVYLLAKPLSRFSIATTKVAVAVAVVMAFAAVPTLLAGFILSGTSDRLAVAYGVGALIAGTGYAALFLLLAVLTRHAVVVGLLYALIWESLVGSFVPGAQALSVQQWALAITKSLLGDRAAPLNVTSAVGLGAAIPLLLVLVVGSTWYAGWRLRTLRLTSDE